MIKKYREDLLSFVGCKRYVVCVAALLVIAYGFAALNPTIGIDDLEVDRYVGDGNAMLAAGRFGIWFWSKLVLFGGPYLNDLFAMALLAFGTMNICILFQRASHGRLTKLSCIAFSSVFMTYPLWSEIWEYTGANAVVSGGIVFASLALLIIFEFLHNKEHRRKWMFPVAVFLMMMVCAGYESVACVYIFLVCAILVLRSVFGDGAEGSLKEIVRQGMVYAGVLAAGLVMRLVVHGLILNLCGLEKQANGATEILWTQLPAGEVLGVWIFLSFFQFGLKALINFPIAELHVAGFVLFIWGILVKKRCGKANGLPLFGMYFSLVILSLIQGSVIQYRSTQVFAAFVAFAVMVLVYAAEQYQGKFAGCVKIGTIVLCCCLCVYQAGYISNVLQWNHVRSEEEAYVVREIGADLERSYDTEKPVVFVGEYSLSPYISEGVSVREDGLPWRLYSGVMNGIFNWMDAEPIEFVSSRQYVQSTVIPMLTWGPTAFDQEGMWKFFKYYGYEYTWVSDPEMVAEAEAYAEETGMPAYPRDGYIVERDNYLIVRIG